jgi:hypothetical protein
MEFVFAAINRSAQAMLRIVGSRRAASLIVDDKCQGIRDLVMITLLIIFLIALALVAGYLLFFAH